MRNIILLISLLLPAGPLVLANEAASPSGAANQKVHVVGCVRRENGRLSLLDDQGQTFKLTGKIKKLRSLVGERVRLKGTTSGKISRPAAMSVNTEQIAPTLDVSSVLDVYETCLRR